LGFFDPRYPQRLRSLHNPPTVLYLRGSLDAASAERAVAVVGTREPSAFGCSATEAITKALADDGWVVTSGLAKGIDTIAHGAALKYHTPTVAVLAGGLDKIYPAENRELADAIVEQGGALVSEQRWGVRPQRSSFVQRNRIQTGLCAAVVVAQTGVSGGTIHTARHAAAQGRAVFCPTPHSDHEKNAGLRVLLDLPARDLCGVLPAWQEDRSLCERLGAEPLARPVSKDDLGGFLDALELALTSDSQSVPEPRWWPTSDPPTRLGDRDVIADDDAQAPLFAAIE
jgi:DNA protecting protein DprA